MYISPFKSAVQPAWVFKCVVVCLSCVWIGALSGCFYGWCGFFHSWPPATLLLSYIADMRSSISARTVNTGFPSDCDATKEWEWSRKVRNHGNLKALWRSRQSNKLPALIVGDRSSASKRH